MLTQIVKLEYGYSIISKDIKSELYLCHYIIEMEQSLFVTLHIKPIYEKK